jgi:transketolase
MVFKGPLSFVPGKWRSLKSGKRIALIATGGLVGPALEAYERASKKMTVINASSLHPIDVSLIEKLSKTHEWLVTAEDHYVVGGLGSAVAEVIASKKLSSKLYRIGLEEFGESGSPEDLYKHYQLDGPGLLKRLEAHCMPKKRLKK